MEIAVNKVFHKNLESTKRIVVNQGGTRSGKTYAILQLFIFVFARQATGQVFTITRKTLSALKGTAMRDFFEILRNNNIYNEAHHNKTEHTYLLYGNLFEFTGMDQPQKKRGAKRDYLFINEANEITFEDWQQLIMRTEKRAFIDYNPSDEFHFIYEDILTRPDCEFIKSTYLDNIAFLPESIINEIELLQTQDENYWRVYGLGERGMSQENIYTHWKLFKDLPVNVKDFCYGLDFGYNHPTALIRCDFSENDVYWKQEIYSSNLITSDLIKEMRRINIDPLTEIWADAADPKAIEEIHRAGYNIKPADKDVLEGIRKVKGFGLYIHQDGNELIREVKSYKWKVDKNGVRLDDPVKFKDDAMDAGRYGTYNHVFKKFTGKYTVI
jgi:phage terminase large subunit